MNVQHGGFKFFVIFIVPWTILSDQKNFKIFWMHFGENRPFLLFPCQKLKIQKKFDLKVEKNFFSQKYIFYLNLINLDTFGTLKSVFVSLMQLLRNFDLNQKADL